MADQVTLTKRQKQILDVVIDYKREHDGNSPSLLVIRDLLIERFSLRVSNRTIATDINNMPELFYRDNLGYLCTIHGGWEMGNYVPEIVVDG